MQILEQATPPTERQLLTYAQDAIAGALPQGWTWRSEPTRGGPRIVVVAPDGRTCALTVDVNSRVDARDVPALAARAQSRESGDARLVVSRYLSPRARAALADAGLSYVDATGNLRVSTSEPGLFVVLQGVDRDPWRPADRPTATLRGVPAARIVRALVDRRPPWKIRELAEQAGTSLGSTSRTVAFLEREALLSRGQAGEITDVEWAALLERWASDYDLERRRRVVGLLQPRPLDELAKPLSVFGEPYAITGSLAAAQWAPYAEGRLAIIYTTEVAALQFMLRLAEAPGRPNVLLIEPDDDYVFARRQQRDHLWYAAPSQVVVDLLNGPGRNPEEGRELLKWMQAHEHDWRTS